jgi:hypothetical protein
MLFGLILAAASVLEPENYSLAGTRIEPVPCGTGHSDGAQKARSSDPDLSRGKAATDEKKTGRRGVTDCYETDAEISTKAMPLVLGIAFCFFVRFFRYPTASSGL